MHRTFTPLSRRLVVAAATVALAAGLSAAGTASAFANRPPKSIVDPDASAHQQVVKKLSSPIPKYP